MPDLLVARTSAVVALGRRRVRIRKGVTIVNADDSFVRGRENLFEPLEVPYIGGGDASKRRRPVVEDATADPGQTREVTLSPTEQPPQETDADSDTGAEDTPSESEPQADPEPAPEPEPEPEPTVKEVRAWAREEDIKVPARGKIPDEVVAAYKRAHGGGW